MSAQGSELATPSAKKASFASDVLKMATGTTSAHLLSVLAAPITARLFAPDAFGLAALFGSLTSTVGVLACLRYENSVVLPKDDEDGANTMALALSCAALVSLLTAPLLWLGRNAVPAWLKAPGLEPYFWLVPIAVFLTGAFPVLNNWCTRHKQFGRITVAYFLNTAFTVGIQIGAGLLGIRSGGSLVLGVVAGLLAGVLFLTIQIWRDSRHVILNSIHVHRIIFAMKRYQRFAKFGLAAAVLNSVSWQIPAFLLAAYFSTSVVGQFSLGQRLLRMPINLIGLNIARVFFQRAAEAHHEGVLHRSVENAFRYLVALSVFPSLMLSLVGTDLFIVIFGQRWAEAGVYSQILSFWVCVWSVSYPLANTFDVLELQDTDLRVQALIFITRVGSLVAGGMIGNARLTLALFSATGVVVYLYYCSLIMTKSGVPVRRMFAILGRSIATFAPAGAVILGAKLLALPHVAVLAVCAVLLLAYFGHLIYSDPLARGFFLQIVQRFFPRTAPPEPTQAVRNET